MSVKTIIEFRFEKEYNKIHDLILANAIDKIENIEFPHVDTLNISYKNNIKIIDIHFAVLKNDTRPVGSVIATGAKQNFAPSCDTGDTGDNNNDPIKYLINGIDMQKPNDMIYSNEYTESTEINKYIRSIITFLLLSMPNEKLYDAYKIILSIVHQLLSEQSK
jgi:hypothetical protein